ncbi:putative F-box protein At1g32420 [Ipomoea triloba]|uniref:putative F-box protein At1g32420 n=1 Tax=Ipomoea triloba TaxID=35885 RepID=UPI00125E390A|nr:putative F-box protein At1g32420 [Ipomoea triloba]
MDGGMVSISNLPADMLLEILKRLPAKTLMKSKCVSKYWLNIIRDSSFAESHFNHARTHRSEDASHLLFATVLNYWTHPIRTIYPATNDDLSLSSQLPSHTFGQYFQPCSNVVNGLVCVCLVEFYHQSQHCIWVLNLTTTEKKPLPEPPSLKAFKTRYPHVNLYGTSRFYLGFDQISNKYKLLHDMLGACEVLTLGINQTWRQVRGNPGVEDDLGLNRIRGGEGFILQGYGHAGMASINGRIYFRNLRERVIVFFDLKEEKFLQVAIPQSIEGISYKTGLVDLGGKLGVVVGLYEPVSQLRIWILEDDHDHNNINNNNWVEKRLTLPDVYYVETMGVTGNHKLILYCKHTSIRFTQPSYFFYYDLKTLERITTTAITMEPHRDPILYNFVGNIVPLDQI